MANEDQDTVTDETTTTTAPPPAPAPAPKPTPAPAATGASEVTFTQAQLDERIGKARTEGRQAAYRYLGKELGVSVVNEDGSIDLTALRGLVDTGRTQRTADSDRLRDLLAKQQELEGQVSEKDSEIAGAINRARQALRAGKAEALAVRLGFESPDDALALLGSLDSFEVDLDTRTVTGLEEALAQLAEKKPYLLRKADAGSTPPPAPLPETPAPAGSKGRTPGEDDDALDAVRSQARTFF